YHPHERVVYGHVAVRMVLAEHIANDGRALLVWPGRRESRLQHRVENAPMDRLEAVAHVRQRALHDHAHRVVEEGFAHLLLDQAGQNALPPCCHCHLLLRSDSSPARALRRARGKRSGGLRSAQGCGAATQMSPFNSSIASWKSAAMDGCPCRDAASMPLRYASRASLSRPISRSARPSRPQALPSSSAMPR